MAHVRLVAPRLACGDADYGNASHRDFSGCYEGSPGARSQEALGSHRSLPTAQRDLDEHHRAGRGPCGALRAVVAFAASRGRAHHAGAGAGNGLPGPTRHLARALLGAGTALGGNRAAPLATLAPRWASPAGECDAAHLAPHRLAAGRGPIASDARELGVASTPRFLHRLGLADRLLEGLPAETKGLPRLRGRVLQDSRRGGEPHGQRLERFSAGRALPHPLRAPQAQADICVPLHRRRHLPLHGSLARQREIVGCGRCVGGGCERRARKRHRRRRQHEAPAAFSARAVRRDCQGHLDDQQPFAHFVRFQRRLGQKGRKVRLGCTTAAASSGRRTVPDASRAQEGPGHGYAVEGSDVDEEMVPRPLRASLQPIRSYIRRQLPAGCVCSDAHTVAGKRDREPASLLRLAEARAPTMAVQRWHRPQAH
mmetsp:Transcript_71509/g.198494  ORF Transcript_71509/g.198494 Transcript_71509/m.198494 type:complete len:426 (-) Transcript_71509:215-1492(-)